MIRSEFRISLACTRLSDLTHVASHPTLSELVCLRQVPYRGLLRTAVGVVREEGLLCLWQGVTPAVCRHVIYTGVRMNGYEWMRNYVREEGASLPVW